MNCLHGFVIVEAGFQNLRSSVRLVFGSVLAAMSINLVRGVYDFWLALIDLFCKWTFSLFARIQFVEDNRCTVSRTRDLNEKFRKNG